MARSKLWTETEDNYLIANWSSKTVDQIAEELDRHRLTILKKAKELGLREPRSRKWTDKEIQYLKDNYKDKTSDELSEELGRSVMSVRKQLQHLGIKKVWTYRRVDKDGYIEVVLGSSLKIREHRLVYSEFLGRKLRTNEHIHHLDFDKQNNDINNLIRLSPSLHNALHNSYNAGNFERLCGISEFLLEHDKPKYKKWLVLIRDSLLL